MDIITGGYGFIGNELVRQLKDLSDDLVIIDNLNRVAPQIGDIRAVRLEEAGITDHGKMREIIMDLKPDRIFHLAAIHFIPECNDNPERTVRINVEGTLGLLRSAAEAGVSHFLYASSGAVYGDSDDALTEGAEIAPVDIYGWSKWQAEQLCGFVSRTQGLNVSVCRFFNNYGPRETNAHIIPEIISQLRSGDVLQLGNIKPRRDYIHTADTAKALIRMGDLPPSGVRVVNVASGDHASVEEIIGIMKELLNRDIRVEKDPSRFRKADKLVQVADIGALTDLLGWSPEIRLKAGLRELLKFEGLLRD